MRAGWDLLDYWRCNGRLSPRRLLLFIEQLPPGSAVDRSIRGQCATWTISDYLLARAVDALEAANWQRGGGKGSRPKPVQRPESRIDRQRKTEYVARLRALNLI